MKSFIAKGPEGLNHAGGREGRRCLCLCVRTIIVCVGGGQAGRGPKDGHMISIKVPPPPDQAVVVS